jgi:cysteinyl-tRNA synthetase
MLSLRHGPAQDRRPPDSTPKEMAMKKWLVLAGAAFLLGGVSGCGGDPNADLVKRMIEEMNKAADTLEEIQHAKDPVEAAKTRAKELEEAGKKLQELKAQADTLKEPPDSEEKKRLAEEYREKFDKAVERASKAWDTIEKMPQYKAIRKALTDKGALANFGFTG